MIGRFSAFAATLVLGVGLAVTMVAALPASAQDSAQLYRAAEVALQVDGKCHNLSQFERVSALVFRDKLASGFPAGAADAMVAQIAAVVEANDCETQVTAPQYLQARDLATQWGIITLLAWGRYIDIAEREAIEYLSPGKPIGAECGPYPYQTIRSLEPLADARRDWLNSRPGVHMQQVDLAVLSRLQVIENECDAEPFDASAPNVRFLALMTSAGEGEGQ